MPRAPASSSCRRSRCHSSPILSATSPTLREPGRLALPPPRPSAPSALPGPLATWCHVQTTLSYRKEKGSVLLAVTAQHRLVELLVSSTPVPNPSQRQHIPPHQQWGPRPFTTPPRFPRPPFTAQVLGAAHLWDAYPPGHAIGRSDGHTATAQRTLDSTAGHQGPPEAHGLSHNPPTSQVTPREHGSDRVGPPGTATGHANRVFRTPFSSLARDCLRSSPAGTPSHRCPWIGAATAAPPLARSSEPQRGRAGTAYPLTRLPSTCSDL